MTYSQDTTIIEIYFSEKLKFLLKVRVAYFFNLLDGI